MSIQSITLDLTSVSESPPESGKRVIFGWKNSHGKTRTSIGFYAAPKTINGQDYWDFEDHEEFYDEETDTYFLIEGWYEEGADGEYFFPTSNVFWWCELPKWRE